jgi:hypothetical protein
MTARALLAALAARAVVSSAAAPGRGPFRVEGAVVYDSTDTPVVFRGIGLSCTEYMARPGFPDPPPADETRHPTPPIPVESWPGSFAWQCFGGRPAANASLQLNAEPALIMQYLLPDTAGGKFITQPKVTKVAWPAPYDEVLSPASPRVVPIVRIPLTSGTWLYDLDANDLGAAGYRTIIDMLVTFFTSQGVAVILDNHASCGGSKIGCKMSGPMALRNYGNFSGALAFWANISATYADNAMVMYELYNEPHVWYQALYGGDQWYAGYAEMYDAVRATAPDALVVIGGSGWSYDAAGPLAIWQQYKKEHNGTALRNVVYNLHVYQGMVRETARLRAPRSRAPRLAPVDAATVPALTHFPPSSPSSLFFAVPRHLELTALCPPHDSRAQDDRARHLHGDGPVLLQRGPRCAVQQQDEAVQ